MGFPVEMFPVLFAIAGRRAGWPSGRRCCSTPSSGSPGPRQIYIGPDERPYVPMSDRAHTDHDLVEPPVKPIGGD